MDCGDAIRLRTTFSHAVEQVRAALGEQGVRVVAEVDVGATVRDRFGKQMEDFLVLGACSPVLATRVLERDRRDGFLLPCNIVVRADGDDVLVEAVDPELLVTVTGRPELWAVPDEARRRVSAALRSVSGR